MELSRAKYTDYAAEKTADEHFDCYWLRSNMAEESDKDASEIEVFNSYHVTAEDAEEDSFKLYDNRGVRPAVRVRIP